LSFFLSIKNGCGFSLLWLIGVGVLLFKLFGVQGLYASIDISLLLANLQGLKLTEIFGFTNRDGAMILFISIILH